MREIMKNFIKKTLSKKSTKFFEENKERMVALINRTNRYFGVPFDHVFVQLFHDCDPAMLEVFEKLIDDFLKDPSKNCGEYSATRIGYSLHGEYALENQYDGVQRVLDIETALGCFAFFAMQTPKDDACTFFSGFGEAYENKFGQPFIKEVCVIALETKKTINAKVENRFGNKKDRF